ncbi:Aldehyde Dehydrogenase [Halococcus morrhuae DSM 1307]|uniref:Aldehyde Dehydrogenase n=1 Tax=Halococcus morrhuae DSM 1307 TaxID=931277 RepID=M0MY17_HALMO|nr:aldehyde dehydrogenase family protein [Halococcus morrhuae]EMA50612.1 Aldehyde Dehydrogenase [Halococcus morrhuae DSM 1307]
MSDLAEGGVFARVKAADGEQAESALAAAENAQSALAATTIPERVAWLEAIAAGLREREDELADVIVREAGKPISSARAEVESAAERFERAVEEARGLNGEFRMGTTTGHEGWEAIIKPEPIGTVLCITPYNYPLSTTALQVAPALAAGNSVVLKPASKTPVSAAILADIVASADIPAGGFNFVPGHAGAIGDVLAGSDQIDAIAMTGSSDAGEHVARQSGIVNLHMELGGNAPAIIFPDADLDAAAAACTKGGLKYAGQRCSAISRVLVHESIHDDLVKRIEGEMDAYPMGDLFDEATALGPLISADQADWVEDLVIDATDRGAEIVRGGRRNGQKFEPTLLGRVPESARLVAEEQFGPVIPMTTFTDENHAIEIANSTDLALDGCVFTTGYDRALRVAERIDAGGVRINGAPSHGLGDIPFGGNEDSGIGREGIETSIEEFVRYKNIVL